MSKATVKGTLVLFMFFILMLYIVSCSPTAGSEAVTAFNEVKVNDSALSVSPDGSLSIYLNSDNNLYIKDENKNKIIYRNYHKDSELLEHPYSLWADDSFRIQWSEDGRYVYIIDSIYDVEGERLINLRDCLIFSWIGNKGVYLADGKLIEGKFWDRGFYGIYASKKVNIFEDGSIRTAKQLYDGKYFIVSEDCWNNSERSLFRCLGPSIEITTAKLRFGEEHTYDRLIKAYQQLREDEKAWAFLENKYISIEDKENALKEFETLRREYPIKLAEESFTEGNLNWDFDMSFYLTEIGKESIS